MGIKILQADASVAPSLGVVTPGAHGVHGFVPPPYVPCWQRATTPAPSLVYPAFNSAGAEHRSVGGSRNQGNEQVTPFICNECL